MEGVRRQVRNAPVSQPLKEAGKLGRTLYTFTGLTDIMSAPPASAVAACASAALSKDIDLATPCSLSLGVQV